MTRKNNSLKNDINTFVRDLTRVGSLSKSEARARLLKIIEEVKQNERERQYDLLMSCLPKNAENLSTLTPDQALQLIKCFIIKQPWNNE